MRKINYKTISITIVTTTTTNKVPKNTFNHRGKRPVLRKL